MPALNSLDDPIALPENLIAEYGSNGFTLVRELASRSEVETFRPAILDAVLRLNNETRPLEQRDTYGKAFLQTMNLWRSDETVSRYVLARRFAHVAAALMGVRAVRLYHDQALFKEPGGGGTPWHQDQHYWPLDTDNTITMWMPLVNADSQMGTMRFAAGSHREGYLGDLPISDESDARFAEFLEQKGYPIMESGSMSAGDATFHSGWTLHGASGNSSSKTREAMTIIYFADGTRVGHADNVNRANDLASWLPGLKPGDLAASDLNPLLG